MKKDYYLLDTHALLFWQSRVGVSDDFIAFFDAQEQNGMLCVSTISFWEAALLVKKQKLILPDAQSWRNELLNNTSLNEIDPTASEMIESTLLPDFHKDPFDRLLIAIARQHDFTLVTQNRNIEKYDVKHVWI